jgi:glutamate:Na+ symporter, ESS family
MVFGPYDMLMDFAIISFLLLIAQILRSKIKLIQNLYLPASVIAGFLGLLFGPYSLNWLPFSDNIATYPYLLIVFLFGSLFLGHTEKLSLKKVIDECGNVFFLNLAAEVGQFACALVFGGLILYILFPDLHQGFALLMPAGFCGGHGYAAAIGGSLDIIDGWKEALTIGQTFATIGILASVFGGIVLINIAARRGVTKIIKTTAELPMSMRTGFIPKDERTTIGTGTVHSIALDPFAWHFALVLIATAGGYYAYHFLRIYLTSYTPAMMSLSMLAGVILIFIMKRLKMARYIDKQIITRIGSTSTDYLVGFGIASINPHIVVKYATPLIIMVMLGVGYSLFFLFVITRKLSEEYWFERGIFTYGWTTGVVSLGITLLRIVDPEFKTQTLDKYGMSYVIIALFEIVIVSLTPMLVTMGYGFITGVVMMIFWFILLGFAYFSYSPVRKKTSFNGSMVSRKTTT